MKNSRKKITILIISIVVFLLLIFGAAYAIIAATTTYDNKNINMAIGSRPIFTAGPSNTIALDIPFVSGTSANVYVIADETSPFNITLQTNYEEKTICSYDIVWEWNETSDTEKQYTKTSGATKEFTVSGTSTDGSFTDVQLNNYNSQDRTTLLYSGSITAAGNNVLKTQNWTFTTNFYKTTQDQSTHRAHSYTGKILVNNVVCGKDNTPTIASYIANNNPAGYRGASHTDSATQNLYRFTGAYQSSDAGYAGNVDNYICLGSSEATCPDDNMYRIIGVVAEDDSTTGLKAGMIKVIKNTSIGIYKWDGGTSASDTNGNVNSSNQRSTWTCTSSNNSSGSSCFPGWHQSYLNTGILNTTYLNSVSSFSDKIASVKWHCYVGSSTPTAASEYSASLCSNTPSKISIIYAGDYLNAYNNGTNNSSDSYIPWIQINNGCSNSGTGNDYKYACGSWTMANFGFYYGSSSFYSWYAWRVYNSGNFGYYYYFYYYSDNLYSIGYATRPVFYLNSGITIASGTGTYASPYIIN